MADIFISYAREDRNRIEPLAKSLEELGWSVFWDRTIPAGKTWRQVIGEALKSARTVIVAWSQKSIESEWVLEEADIGRSRDILVPILIDNVHPPLGFRALQAADLSQWDGDKNSEPFRYLVRDAAQLLGLPSQAVVSPEPIRARGEWRPLNEAKLILVGFGGVGKTSLVNRVVLDRPFSRHEAKTEGIRITDWTLYLRAASNDTHRGGHVGRWHHLLSTGKTASKETTDSDKVGVHVWDFGGQEIMHATHQFFLTDRALYLLILCGRQGREDSDAEYWLNVIKSFAPTSPIIVVLNKIKEQPFDLNRGSLKTKFDSIHGFIETDCEDDTGIDKLRSTVSHEINRLPHLRASYPAPWFEVRDRVAQMRANYLGFDNFRRLCEEAGEADAKAQEDLASFLNSLGIAISYRDDPRLCDLHVLKPEWVTEGIYTIINSKQLVAKRGELKLEQLANILNSNKYPRESHEFLVELMRKFDLCFRFPGEEDRYLIPELLDKQEPSKAIQDFPMECLNFEYRYPIELPPGLLPRFIVRTAALSVEEPRWRSGVFLFFEGNRALVQAAATDRTIRVSVAGSSLGRRRLLAVIRADFGHIHRDYVFRPEEMVPVPDYAGVVIPYEKLLTYEQKNITTFPEVYGQEVLTLNVKNLLDGVDLGGIRPIRPDLERGTAMLSAFVSYARKDDWLAAELATHLKLLQRRGLIKLWRDRCITAGSEWQGQIDENLKHADLVLLLVSSDFIASDYCWDIEMNHAMERHKEGKTRVIPIIVRPCSWQKAPFGELQCLPSSSKAVHAGTGRPARDKAWTKVAQGIEAALKDLSDAKSAIK